MDPDAPIDLPASLSSDAGGDLLATYWPSAIAFAVAVGLVVLLVRHQRRGRTASRRRRVARSFGWGVPAAIALIVAVALGVNTWVGYIPSIAAAQRWLDTSPRSPVTVFPDAAVTAGSAGSIPATGARLTTENRGYSFLTSIPANGRDMPDAGAWVYLPPDYDAPGNTARYPVIYALHGAPGTAADWFAGGRIDQTLDALIAQGYFPPAIVVSPDLNAGPDKVETEPLNRPGGPQLEDFVVKDVVTWADSQLRTQPEAGKRIVAGMSAGGLGALLYGLHHPDIFSSVVSILPYTEPYTPEVIADPESAALNTPLTVIAARGGATDQKIFLGQGDGEKPTEATQIRDALRAQGQVTTLRVLPGLDHNWTAARTIMPYGLVWIAQQWGWEPPR